MDAFPAFVPLAGTRVVVAGGGEAADAKARLFEGSPAELVRIAGETALDPMAYTGARLAFIAGEEAWSRRAVAAARAAGAWVNAVDRPELCDFNTPGIVDRGAVVGAVGTVGAAPVLAVHLRQEWEVHWPAGLGGLARLMGTLRPAIREAASDWAGRRRLLTALMQGPWAEAALAGGAAQAERLARDALLTGRLGAEASGEVRVLRLPAEADLLTLRDARLIGRADRLVLDGLIPADVLALARRDAPREVGAGPGWAETCAARGERVVVLTRGRLLNEGDAAGASATPGA